VPIPGAIKKTGDVSETNVVVSSWVENVPEGTNTLV
jgi:hypothetical protein